MAAGPGESTETLGFKTAKNEVPAKVKKGEEYNAGRTGAKVAKIGEGDEELEIGGKKVKCRWVEVDVEAKEGKARVKTWTSSDLVAGLARMVMSAESPVKSTTTLTFMESKTE